MIFLFIRVLVVLCLRILGKSSLALLVIILVIIVNLFLATALLLINLNLASSKPVAFKWGCVSDLTYGVPLKYRFCCTCSRLTEFLWLVFIFLLEDNFCTMLCWSLPYNNVNQSYIYIYIYIYRIYIPSHLSATPPPSILLFYVVTEHQAWLLVLCSRVPLLMYFTHGSVYMSVLLSQFVLTSLSPAVPTSMLSTSVSPFLLCK